MGSFSGGWLVSCLPQIGISLFLNAPISFGLILIICAFQFLGFMKCEGHEYYCWWVDDRKLLAIDQGLKSSNLLKTVS